MRVLEAPTSEDWTALTRYLRTRSIAHRVFEESGRQILVVESSDDREIVREAYDAWRAGRLGASAASGRAAMGVPALVAVIAAAPGTAGVLVAAWLTYGALAVYGDVFATRLLIVDSMVEPDFRARIGHLFSTGLYRWWTPTLLHFSATHILFNSAVVWVLGSRIEMRRGLWWCVLIGCGIASNVAQYLWSGYAAFGGLSGVAYAMVGVGLAYARWGMKPLPLPPGLLPGLLVFLVIFSTGVTELFNLHVANAAHWGGLLTGLILGWVWIRAERSGR